MAYFGGLIGCFIAVMVLVGSATAETYDVGGEMGWNVPSGGNSAYETWAAGKVFEVGDEIVFRWNGTHDVAEVTKENYDNCTDTPIGQIQTTSPANFNLTSNSTRYFICTIGDHCELGQKVAITTGASSSASSLTVGALSAVFYAITISFLTFH